MTSKTLSFIIVFLSISISCFSQSKTGNIVEYFGKEKINDIGEGKLHHVFTDGLLLSHTQAPDNSATFPDNAVVAAFLQDPFMEVKDGQVFDIDYEGNAIKWEAITTDSTNTFRDRRLRRSGYLYLQFFSTQEETVLLEASGHTQVLINGLPHEGDHYDFGYSLIPIQLKKGKNTFLLTPGRFARMRARLILPDNDLLLTTRDMTLPDLLLEEEDKTYIGAVRIINSKAKKASNITIRSSLNGKETTTAIRELAPFTTVKVPFDIPFPSGAESGKLPLTLNLLDSRGKTLSSITTDIKLSSHTKHHKRTFISDIDGSLQYFSVAPSTNQEEDNQALFLSVHGASVEAFNQANAYQKKDWGNLIAPTNRRPFGFAWEDWGRMDAMEVLQEAKRIYRPDESKIYLTGHSMGGHGTWYLGATYPDQFGAIAPCAGYPDLLGYRSFYRNRLRNSSEMRARLGITEKQLSRMFIEKIPSPIENIITRAGNPSRTLKLKRNYLQHGVYILHGEKDNVVPTAIAREMRANMGTFHPDFTYYEYPDGTHWYGNHSVDWPPIFDFFRQRNIPKSSEIEAFEFYTASPGVSATSHFIEIYQQKIAFAISSVKVQKADNHLIVNTDNIRTLAIDNSILGKSPDTIVIDGQSLKPTTNSDKTYLSLKEEIWQISDQPVPQEKNPKRYGGFKDAFNHNVVLVYATGGDDASDAWYYNRARFDAETFWYRANGNIPILKDVDFDPEDYLDRNVILYGNKDNNKAWDKLLAHAPIQFRNGYLTFGDVRLSGDHWAGLFIYPKNNHDTTSIGVVTSTGMEGSKAAYNNNYLRNGTTFPDFMLFDPSVLTNGVDGVKCAGFFGNDWSIEKGEFEWK